MIATPVVLAAGVAISFIDFDSWFPDNSSPNNGAITEPFDHAALPPPPQSDADQITSEIEDALTPFDHTVGEFDTYDVPGLMQNEDGEIFYYDWFVENDVYEANVLTSQITGLPLAYSFAVQALESSMDPEAFNNRSKACGLSQFVPSTLAQYAYQYAPLIGYEGVRDNLVVREREKLEGTNADGDPLYNLTYSYPNLNAQHTMVHTCFDPHFNTRLIAVMHLREIGSLQSDLEEFAPEGMDYYPITELEGYIAHFAGGSGGERILRDLLSNNGESEAREFFSASAIGTRENPNITNQRLLFHPKNVTDDEGNTILDDEGNILTVPDWENPRTVAEFVEFLSEDKGLSDTPLPNFTDWGALSERIANNMESLEVSAVTVQLSYSPAFEVITPNPRPNNGGG